MGFKNAQVWYDGVENPNGSTMCLDENDNVVIANLDAGNESKNPSLIAVGEFACKTNPKLTLN